MIEIATVTETEIGTVIGTEIEIEVTVDAMMTTAPESVTTKATTTTIRDQSDGTDHTNPTISQQWFLPESDLSDKCTIWLGVHGVHALYYGIQKFCYGMLLVGILFRHQNPSQLISLVSPRYCRKVSLPCTMFNHKYSGVNHRAMPAKQACWRPLQPSVEVQLLKVTGVQPQMCLRAHAPVPTFMPKAAVYGRSYTCMITLLNKDLSI